MVMDVEEVRERIIVRSCFFSKNSKNEGITAISGELMQIVRFWRGGGG